MKKPTIVYGVGINDLEYKTQIFRNENGKQIREWICPFYRRWHHMLERSYSKKFHALYPSYIGVKVCDEWLSLSNFKEWMKGQDWEGKHLDKDLLMPGNKIYCPEMCVFVDHNVNSFILDRRASRGKYPIGVSLHKQSGKFEADCWNPLTGKRDRLGKFSTPELAHEAWRKTKHSHAIALAGMQKDARVRQALEERYKT